MTPSLSIVIPVFNEPDWLPIAVADVVTAQQASRFENAELIIVDDGSDAPTKAAIETLSVPIPVHVIHQANAGRHAARRRGIQEARGDLVLLIDSRVSIRPDALRFVADRIQPGGTLPIWNAHVDIDLHGNPYARFWNVLTEIAFREYFAEPRTTSFGVEEFDRFPKGTTCFLAPRELLMEATESIVSLYDDTRRSNDDTPMIRRLVSQSRINISPGFSCLYRSRTTARGFLRHAYHRGTVFVDGFLRPGTRFFVPLLAFFPVSALVVALTFRQPRLAAVVATSTPMVGAAVGTALRRPPRDIVALAVLGPAWTAAYAFGIWRGALLALRSRTRRR